MEWLVLAKASSKAEVVQLMRESRVLPEIGFKVEDAQFFVAKDIQAKLEQRSEAEVNQLTEQVLEKMPQWLDFLGGAMNDVWSREGRLSEIYVSDGLYGLAYRLQSSKGEVRREVLARILAGVNALSQITASEWVAQSKNQYVDPGSKLGHIMQRLGVFNQSAGVFSAPPL